MSFSTFASRVIYENPSHRLRRSGKKVRSVIPLALFITGESQPGFVNECCGLESLARSFQSHLRGCQSAQFLVNERQQFIGRTRVAWACCVQDAGDLVHALTFTKWIVRLVKLQPCR